MQCEEDWLVMHALHAHHRWSISRIRVPGGYPGCIHGRRSRRLLLRAEPGGGCERYLHLQRKRLGRGHIQVLGIRPTRNGWYVALLVPGVLRTGTNPPLTDGREETILATDCGDRQGGPSIEGPPCSLRAALALVTDPCS